MLYILGYAVRCGANAILVHTSWVQHCCTSLQQYVQVAAATLYRLGIAEQPLPIFPVPQNMRAGRWELYYVVTDTIIAAACLATAES